MRDHAVLVAGGGPTGLMLAAELALAGADVAVLERRPGLGLAEPRAKGLHARTLEILDQRGIADRFLAAGTIAQVAGFARSRSTCATCRRATTMRSQPPRLPPPSPGFPAKGRD